MSGYKTCLRADDPLHRSPITTSAGVGFQTHFHHPQQVRPAVNRFFLKLLAVAQCQIAKIACNDCVVAAEFLFREVAAHWNHREQWQAWVNK